MLLNNEVKWRPAATALIPPLAWELPHATGAALKSKKQNKTKPNEVKTRKKQTNKDELKERDRFLITFGHLDPAVPKTNFPEHFG